MFVSPALLNSVYSISNQVFIDPVYSLLILHLNRYPGCNILFRGSLLNIAFMYIIHNSKAVAQEHNSTVLVIR